MPLSAGYEHVQSYSIELTGGCLILKISKIQHMLLLYSSES